MDYLEKFPLIDKNEDGIITRRELFKYALSIGEDISMVDTWFKLFDSHDRGIITIEEVSRTLGVPPPKFYKERLNRRQSTSEWILNDQGKGTGFIPAWERRSMDAVDLVGKEPTFTEQLQYDGEDDVQRIEAEVCKKLRQHLIEANEKNMQDSVMAAFIARQLEDKYGPNWQVIVSRVKIGCAIGHLLGKFAEIQHDVYHAVAYQTLEF